MYCNVFFDPDDDDDKSSAQMTLVVGGRLNGDNGD